jgi:hypothetical protein
MKVIHVLIALSILHHSTNFRWQMYNNILLTTRFEFHLLAPQDVVSFAASGSLSFKRSTHQRLTHCSSRLK